MGFCGRARLSIQILLFLHRSHEDMSVQLFECILEDKHLLESGDLTKQQAERVKAMILAGSAGLNPYHSIPFVLSSELKLS